MSGGRPPRRPAAGRVGAGKDRFLDDCPVCASNRGVRRISPGPVIYEGACWQVEHAYPCSLPGWLVIVLGRHAEALHELTEAEAAALGPLQRRVARALRDELGCVKEYSVCYGEAPGFSHLHLHLIPRAPDLDEDRRAGGIFHHLRGAEEPEDPVRACPLPGTRCRL